MEIAWSPPTETIVLAEDTLDVWAVRLDDGGAQSADWEANLSAAERRRAEQFRLDEPRRRFVVARAALRTLLGDYLGLAPKCVALETEPGGKPRLADTHRGSGLHFSVAHSANLALIAVTAGCAVGIDLERIRNVNHAEHIARRFFHPAETEAIVTADRSARDAVFLRCWTGKEAVLKAIGSGITGALASFHVPADGFDAASIALPAQVSDIHRRCWLRSLAPCPGYVGAVACLGDERRVRSFLLRG